MAEVSKDQIDAIVARVTQEFGKEVQANEAKTLAVAELRDQAAKLNQVGGEAAWTISYSTAAASLEALRKPGGEAAWTISYSTAASAVEDIASRPGG